MRYGFSILLVLLVTSFASVVQAQSTAVQSADDLLSAWQMDDAKKMIDALSREYPGTPEVEYLRGRYAFFQGDYQAAVGHLDKALSLSPRRDWQELRDVVASTHEVTKDYVKHTSPSGRFAIWIEPGKDEVLLPLAFEALEKAYVEIGDELGYKPATPIRVEVYPRTDVLAKVSILTEQEIRNSGTIALCKYNRLMITSPKALLRGYGWVDTLVHEYVHYVINSKTKNRVPIWMHEGLAKFLERRWRGPDAHRLPPSSEHLLQKRVKADDLITFAQMHPSMAKLPTQEDSAVAFAEVYAAMEYLRAEAGEGAFRKVLEKISDGTDAQVAFASVLGKSFMQFEKEWRISLRNRPAIDYPEDSGFDERLVFKDEKEKGSLKDIPQPRARDHVHLAQMLHARDRFGAAVVEYRKATRLMGDTHPVVMTRLAQSLIELKRPTEALDALQKVKGSFPGYVQTWIELGRAAVRAKRFEDARMYLEEAARINPFDPTIYEELETVYRELDDAEALRLAKKHRKLVM